MEQSTMIIYCSHEKADTRIQLHSENAELLYFYAREPRLLS